MSNTVVREGPVYIHKLSFTDLFCIPDGYAEHTLRSSNKPFREPYVTKLRIPGSNVSHDVTVMSIYDVNVPSSVNGHLDNVVVRNNFRVTLEMAPEVADAIQEWRKCKGIFGELYLKVYGSKTVRGARQENLGELPEDFLLASSSGPFKPVIGNILKANINLIDDFVARIRDDLRELPREGVVVCAQTRNRLTHVLSSLKTIEKLLDDTVAINNETH